MTLTSPWLRPGIVPLLLRLHQTAILASGPHLLVAQHQSPHSRREALADAVARPCAGRRRAISPGGQGAESRVMIWLGGSAVVLSISEELSASYTTVRCAQPPAAVLPHLVVCLPRHQEAKSVERIATAATAPALLKCRLTPPSSPHDSTHKSSRLS